MDYVYGIKSENEVIACLKQTHPEILKTAQNHPFDFVTNDTFFELKSRRNNHDTYPDTMIGYNKIQYARMNPDKNYVFLFKFLDGLYKHDFDPQKNYSVRQGGRTDRGAPEIKDYVFIPVKELTLVSP
jgi:hypothetical protein